MVQNSTLDYGAYLYGDSHEGLEERPPIADAEPLDDPLNIDPNTRVRYFRNNIYPYAYRMNYQDYYSVKRPIQVELVRRLEEMIVESGIHLIKLYFSVSRHEQLRRFDQRASDPLKQWKISTMDLLSKDRWDEYTAAKEDMFVQTHTGIAPWTIIKSEDKMRARINAMRHLVHVMSYAGKDESVAHRPDPSIVAYADEIYQGCTARLGSVVG